MTDASSEILLLAGDGEPRRCVSNILADEGFRVVWCDNQQEALARIRRQTPAVTVASAGLIGRDLQDLSRTLKETDPASWLVLLTDGAGSEAVAAPVDGALECAADPLHPGQLLAAVRNAMQLRRISLENLELKARMRRLTIELETMVAERSQVEELGRPESAGSVGDEERRKLSEELHDNVIVSLAAIAVDLGFLKRLATQRSPELEDGLAALGDRIKDTDRRLRQVVWRIFPSVLTNLGLVPALRSYLQQLSGRPISSPYPLAIQLRARGLDQGRLPEELEIGLYRAVEQAVGMAIQGGGAKSLQVDLTRSNAEVALLVTVDGAGFAVSDPGNTTFAGGLGLINLHHRIRSLGGTLEVESPRIGGTTLRAWVPAPLRVRSTEEPQSSTYILSNHSPAMGPHRRTPQEN